MPSTTSEVSIKYCFGYLQSIQASGHALLRLALLSSIMDNIIMLGKRWKAGGGRC